MRHFLSAASFFLPALTFATVAVDSSLDLSIGYHWDSYQQSATIDNDPGTSKYKNLNGPTTTLKGDISFNRSFFVSGSALYGWNTQQPSLTVPEVPTIYGEKDYLFEVGGSVGWLFDLCQNKVTLYPAFGYSYSRLKFDSARYLAVGAPFIAFGMDWEMAPKWRLHTGLEYAFAGVRREIFYAPGARLTDGSFQGPRGKLSVGYAITDQWSLGLGAQVRYLFSQKKNFTINGGFAENMQTKWLGYQGFMSARYSF